MWLPQLLRSRSSVRRRTCGPIVPWLTIVWNDPINLMSYVTYVFQTVFGYPRAKAEKLMLDVHHKGKAVVASGTREEMERDAQILHSYGLWATIQQDRSDVGERRRRHVGAGSVDAAWAAGSGRRDGGCRSGSTTARWRSCARWSRRSSTWSGPATTGRRPAGAGARHRRRGGDTAHRPRCWPGCSPPPTPTRRRRAEFRRYTEASLRDGKRADAAGRCCDTAVPGRIELDAEQAQAWLRALNDVRLALGTRLDVTEEVHERDRAHVRGRRAVCGVRRPTTG